MAVKILHLYHDLMNLYGDHGNVAVLERTLRDSGAEVEIDRCSLRRDIDLCSYDLIYLGSGTEKSELIALNDIKRHREALITALDEGRMILATGNSFELFGKSIKDASGEIHEGLGIFDFEVTLSNKERTLCDQVCLFEHDKEAFKCVGFINSASSITDISSPMFTVENGAGNSAGDQNEGIMSGSFCGTHLTGPCLVKNPQLLGYFVKKLLKKENIDGEAVIDSDLFEAYNVTLSALTERFSK